MAAHIPDETVYTPESDMNRLSILKQSGNEVDTYFFFITSKERAVV